MVEWDPVGWRKGCYSGLPKNHKDSQYSIVLVEIDLARTLIYRGFALEAWQNVLDPPLLHSEHRCSAELLGLLSSPWPVTQGTKLFVVSISLSSWIWTSSNISLLCFFQLCFMDCLYQRLKIIIDALQFYSLCICVYLSEISTDIKFVQKQFDRDLGLLFTCFLSGRGVFNKKNNSRVSIIV